MDSNALELIPGWEKQPGETNRAFGAFKVYRDLPAHKRSLRNAVREMYGEFRQGRFRQWAEWSRHNQWVNRAAAWDQELDREQRANLLKQIEESNTRHIQIVKGLQQIAIERLRTVKPIELDVADLKSWLVDAIKLERIILGQPDQIVKEDLAASFELIDYTQMTNDQLRAMLARKMLNSPTADNVDE